MHKYNINTKRNSSYYDQRIYNINDNYFDNINTPEKAYFLGFIMADGCVLDKHNQLQFNIHKRDRDILVYFLNLLESNYPIIKHKEDYVSMVVTSKKIVNDLILLGIVPNKTKVLKMPKINKELYPHLIRGYFDGDGSIWFDKQANSYRIQFIGTENILTSIKQILQLSDNKLRYTNDDKTICRLGYSGNIKVFDILSLLYNNSTIHLERKYQKYLECKKLKEYNNKIKRY